MDKSTYEALSKLELIKLCDDLMSGTGEVLNLAVSFFVAETNGLWHGRARAKLARRMKHVALTDVQAKRIVEVVIQRFVAGRFSEQFKDQLRLCLRLAPERVFEAARGCQKAKLPHVKRYSDWLLTHVSLEQRAEQVARANAR